MIVCMKTNHQSRSSNYEISELMSLVLSDLISRTYRSVMNFWRPPARAHQHRQDQP